MPTTIDALQLQVTASSDSAKKAISNLTTSLGRLRTSLSKGLNSSSVVTSLENIERAANKLNSNSKITQLSQALGKLKGIGSISLPKNLSDSLTKIGTATSTLSSSGITNLSALGGALSTFPSTKGMSVTSFSTGLSKLITSIGSMSGTESANLNSLATGLSSISAIGKLPSFTTLSNDIDKLVKTVNGLSSADLSKFKTQITELNSALQPLLTNVTSASSGLTSLASIMSGGSSGTGTLGNSVSGRSGSSLSRFLNTAKRVLGFGAISITASSFIDNANQYIEDINLFTASMGKYADAAEQYAEQVGQVMGIDPAEWMKNQGVFNTLITGFGVAGERAAQMSKNLTQLGYDLSSFFNIATSGEGGTMQKLQAAISGELEPVRRLGYDLSQTKLQAIATQLGIKKTFTAMNQAEKSELRYIALMTEVTTAQGDMSRTLSSPANQLRILQAQVTQAARAIGDIFIPMLNRILPAAIAAVEGIRAIAEALASLVGFELPTVDYSSLEDASDSTSTIADNTASASKSAKEMLADFDELNVITSTSSGSGSGSSNSSGFGFDLSQYDYDFIGDAVNEQVDNIKKKIQPFIDFIKSNLTDILATVQSIGSAILLWKVGGSLLKDFATVNKITSTLKSFAAGLTSGVLTVGLSFALQENFLSTGSPIAFIGDLLTTALGTAITGQLTYKAATAAGMDGSFAGSLAAGLVLAISGVVTFGQNLKTKLAEGVSAKTIADDILSALKVSVGAGLISWATVGEASAALGAAGVAGSITLALGAAINIASIYGDVKENGITDSMWTSAITSALELAGAGALAGFVIGGPVGAAVGAAIGATISIAATAIVTIAAVNAKNTEDDMAKVDWGEIELTQSEIATKVQGMLGVSVTSTVSVLKASITNKDSVASDINSDVSTIQEKLTTLNLGVGLGKKSDVISSIQTQMFGTQGDDSDNGLIGDIQSMLDKHSVVISLAAGLAEGSSVEGDMNQAVTLSGINETLITNAMTDLGGRLSTALSTAFTDGVTDKIQNTINELAGTITEVSMAISKGTDYASFDRTTKILLEDLNRDSAEAVLTKYTEEKQKLYDQYLETNQQAYDSLYGETEGLKILYQEYLDLGETETAEKYKAQIEANEAELLKLADVVGITEKEIQAKTAAAKQEIQQAMHDLYDGVIKENAEIYGLDLSDMIAGMFLSDDYHDLTQSKATIDESIGNLLQMLIPEDYDAYKQMADTIGKSLFDVLPDELKKSVIEAVNENGSYGEGGFQSVLKQMGYDVSGLFDGEDTGTPNTSGTMSALNAIESKIDTIRAKMASLGFKYTPVTITSGTGYVSGYADGGFPSYGSMFVAGEAGAELVGNINGKTAVANEDQIVQGISSGVSQANEGVIEALGVIANLLRQNGGSSSGSVSPNAQFGRFVKRSLEMYQGVTG